ncbi:uncharacterized protein LOC131008033 [Salvia miltiorrhiza]|uniref:uncharacterized protein LOC131008033 n=1 Tax=Salvia miltiorrhiza TaxID=226208 RepID=UPI0025AD9031|nr:uncharacterized protein LOC131008033 [Salvia miltiorrhiza]
MVKWAIELSEYDVDFESRTTIKAQALADFVQETTGSKKQKPWLAAVDGSVTKEGCGVGIHIQTSMDDSLQFAIKYEQRLSNNEVEYEAVIKALTILAELGAESVHVKSNSQLVVQQLLGEYDVREERIAAYHVHALELMTKFQDCHIEQPNQEGKQQVLSVEIREDWRTLIIHFLKTGERLDPVVSQCYLYGRYRLINEQLNKRSFTRPLLKCLSPKGAQFAISKIHQGCCGNHAGYKDLKRKIVRAGFYWPTMGEDAKDFVKKCVVCQKYAARINTPGETMGTMYATCPFDKWGIDIVGKLPTTPGGSAFSLWRYGSPMVLVSDNGSQLTGKMIEEFCHRMDIVHRFVFVAYPPANGQVELTNRIICEWLKKRLEKSKGRWAEELDGVL